MEEPSGAPAVAEGAEAAGTSEIKELDESFIPVLREQDLPKGERKSVVVDGKEMLVFWYRNKIWACESRSPTEGAYSVGFMGSRFTENYGIECPETGTVFSIQTGEILDWYPNNAVLRSLIPSDTCRKLEVYPVEVKDDTIYASFSQGSQGGVMTNTNKGGATSSLEGNNVFFQEPTVYLEGTEPGQPSSSGAAAEAQKLNPLTVIVGTVAVAIISIAGTGLAIYNESVYQLIGFWVVMLAGVGSYVYRFIDTSDEDKRE